MADGFYQNYCQTLLNLAGAHGTVDLDDAATNVKVGLRDEGAAPGVPDNAEVDLADVSAGHVATSGNVATKTVSATAVFDHADVTFTAVSGASCESLDYYKDSGAAATSPLICNIDSATGLPVTPNGGDINWVPNASGVFQITALV